MSNTERSEKIKAIFAQAGVIISYATITDDNRLAVRCDPSQETIAAIALKGIGYTEIQTIKSFDEILHIGTRA